MKKLIIRFLLLLILFIGVFAFAYSRIPVYSNVAEELQTVKNDSGMPVISFAVNGNEINQTEGYSVARESLFPRESITPLSTEQNFEILIKPKKLMVRKMSVRVLTVPELNVLEEKEFAALNSKEDGRLSAEIRLENPLVAKTEYLCAVTLTDSEGKKYYYYTRLQQAAYGSLSGSLAFLSDFHASSFDKEKVQGLSAYMETDDKLENKDFSYVNINSDLDTLSYGSLSPVEIYRLVPTICEYNESFVSARLDFWIQAYTEQGLETYQCREGFRFRYKEEKCILYNYERHMNALFDGSFFMPGENRVKLGIIDAPDVESLTDKNNKYMLFSYQGTLWHLDLENKKLTTVLSYRTASDLDRSVEPEYAFELLSLDEEGNADFAVCGIIGKGAYEGRSGIIYYHYNHAEKRIEEQMFIPVNLPFEQLVDEFGKVSYLSEMRIYYFTLFDAYYAYELDTHVLHTIAEKMGNNWLYFEDRNVLVYNENPDVTENRRLVVQDIGMQTTSYIDAEPRKVINLLETVDGRIVYGLADPEKQSFFDDGSLLLPYAKLIIAEPDGSIVKRYKPEKDRYIADVSFEPGLISMGIYTLDSEAAGDKKAVLSRTDRDVIINLAKEKKQTVSFTDSYSLLSRKEYYLTLPAPYESEKVPEKSQADFLVVDHDTSAIVNVEDDEDYTVYSYGLLLKTTSSPGEAMELAYENKGSVVDAGGRVIFRYGMVSNEKSIDGLAAVKSGGEVSSSQAVLSVICGNYGVDTAPEEFDLTEKSMLEWMKEKLGDRACTVNGASVDVLCYFISGGNPVIINTGDHYVVMYAYTKNTVSYYDPASGTTVKKNKSEIADMINGSEEACFSCCPLN